MPFLLFVGPVNNANDDNPLALKSVGGPNSCLMRYLLIISLFIASLTAAFAVDYTPTDAYAVKFATAKAEGTFRGLNGTINFDPEALDQSTFDVYVETATISTGNKSKDKHARGSSWLDAENHPHITFKSTGFTRIDKGYRVAGKLSIRGVSKDVSIPFTFGADKVFSGKLTVNRQDYGVEGPFLFGGLVGDEVAVSLRIPVE